MTINVPRALTEILSEIEEEKSAALEAIEITQPYHIAFVIDGVAQQVFHVDERMAAIFLSNPLIVPCDSPANGGPDTGWNYNAETNTFTKN
jgi:hypothetical protein